MSLVHQESNEIFHLNSVVGDNDRSLSSCDENISNGMAVFADDHTRFISNSLTDDVNDQLDNKSRDIFFKKTKLISSDDDSSKEKLAQTETPDSRQETSSMEPIQSDSSDEDVVMKRRSLQKKFTDSDEHESGSENVEVFQKESDELENSQDRVDLVHETPDNRQEKRNMEPIQSDSSDEDIGLFIKRRSIRRKFTDSDEHESGSENVEVFQKESDQLENSQDRVDLVHETPDNRQEKRNMEPIQSDSSDEDIFIKRRSLQRKFTDSDEHESGSENVEVFQKESDQLENSQDRVELGLKITKKRRVIRQHESDSDEKSENEKTLKTILKYGKGQQSASKKGGSDLNMPEKVKKSKQPRKSPKNMNRKDIFLDDSDSDASEPETNNTTSTSRGNHGNTSLSDKDSEKEENCDIQQKSHSKNNLTNSNSGRSQENKSDSDSGLNLSSSDDNILPTSVSKQPGGRSQITPPLADSDIPDWKKQLQFANSGGESSEEKERSYESRNESSPEVKKKSFSKQRKKKMGTQGIPRKPKPASKKLMQEEKRQILSEAQRRLRTQRVELPSCHVKQHTLDEFLAKRRSLPKMSNTSIKMSAAEINKWMEREKQLKLMYRSESSDSEKENGRSMNSSQLGKSLDVAHSSQMHSSIDMLKGDSSPLNTLTNLQKDGETPSTNKSTLQKDGTEDDDGPTCTELLDDMTTLEVSKADVSNSDICKKKSSVSKQLFGTSCEGNVDDDLYKASLQSEPAIEEENCNLVPPDSRPAEENVHCEEKVRCTGVADLENALTGSSSNECVSSENTKPDSFSVDSHNGDNLVTPATCMEAAREEGDMSRSTENCTIEEKLRKLRETLAEEADDSDGEFLFRLSEDSDSETDLKSKQSEEVKISGLDVVCNKNDVVKETSRVSELMEVIPDKSAIKSDSEDQSLLPNSSKEFSLATLEYGSRRLALLRQKGLVSIDNMCPRLSSGPEDVVDLDDVPQETKKDGVMSLMERFNKHITKPKPAKQRHVDLSKLSSEKDGVNLEGIKKEVVTILLGDEDEEEGEHVRGSKYLRLRQGLQQQIAEERKAEWLKRSQMNEEKTDDEKSECGLLDEEEEMTVSEEEEEVEDEEEEEEEEDVPLVENHRTKNAFMDDEAEVSEEEDADISPDEEEDEGEDFTKVKQKKVSIMNGNEEEENEDVDEGDADISSSEEEEEEDCSKTHRKKKRMKRSKREDHEHEEEENLNSEETPLDDKTSTPNDSHRRFHRLVTHDLFDSDEETNSTQVLGNEQDPSASMSSTYMSSSMVPGGQTVTPREHEPSPAPTGRLFDFLSPIVVGDQSTPNSPYGTPTSSKEAPSNLQKSFSKQLFFDAEDIPSTQEYMEVLMGTTNANKKKQDPPATILNISGLLGPTDDLPTSQAADDELMGLMSGTFVTQVPYLDTESQCKSNIFTKFQSQQKNTQSSDSNSWSNDFASSQTEQGASQKKDEKRQLVMSDVCNTRQIQTKERALEDQFVSLSSTREEHSQRLSMALVSSDEEEIGLSSKSELISKKKTQKKLDFSDDEDTEAEDDFGSDNEDLGSEGRNPALIEYDSEENEVIRAPNMARTKDFFDVEAELTESEWESADEDERGMDKLESEDGDDEQLDTDAMKEQLGQMHMRQVLDEDQREVRLLQEMLFEDGDLHSEGGGRERKFRWRNSDDGFAADNVRNDSDDGAPNEAEEEEEELWRKARHERETFLRKQREKAEATGKSVEGLLIEEDSQLLILGKRAMKRMRSIHSHEQTIVEKTKITIVKSYSEPILSPDSKNPFKIMAKRGSFLARGENALTRIASLARGTSDNVVLNNNNSSRNCVFATISPKEEPLKEMAVNKMSKRKIMTVTPTLVKKPKLAEEKSQGRRLFDHLT